MSSAALPCFICLKALPNVLEEEGGNQPMGGTEFVTRGHYGSSVFDPMDGSTMILNVCDSCLRGRSSQTKIIGGARV